MLINNLISRLPNGLADQQVGALLGQAPFPTKSFLDFFSFFDEFMMLLPPSAASTANGWTTTNAGGGTIAVGGDIGGSVLFTTGSSVVSAQANNAAFLPVSGKRLFGRIRLKAGDIVNTIVNIGLIITDTSPADATDGIFLRSVDGSAVLSLFCQSAATVTTANTPVVTMVDGTYYTIDLYYDGDTRIYFAVNGTVTGYLEITSAMLPDVAAGVVPTIAITAGASGSAETLEVDTLWFAQER